ncbi:hypothetical protein PPYR_13450 [Photinus pyralis]|uniref:Uncharacterized protein n=1 Tax=Photinus pyralis TaxID=7054 RepID=A0A5N4A928_PHOPY|nr:glycine-rich protein 23-like [Photinus pyralis]KAB0793830.1 hypothetical protein PPYR_13450 [Photinus pyralis]
MKPFIALITLACTFLPRTASSFLPSSLYGGAGGISSWGSPDSGALSGFGGGLGGISQWGGGLSDGGFSPYGGGISPILGESGGFLGGYGNGGISPWGAQNHLGLGGYESSPFPQYGGIGGIGGIGGVSQFGLPDVGGYGGPGYGSWGVPDGGVSRSFFGGGLSPYGGSGLNSFGSSLYPNPLLGGSYGYGSSIPQHLGGLGQLGYGGGGVFPSGVDPSGFQLGGSSYTSPLISSFRSSVISKRSAE